MSACWRQGRWLRMQMQIEAIQPDIVTVQECDHMEQVQRQLYRMQRSEAVCVVAATEHAGDGVQLSDRRNHLQTCNDLQLPN